MGKNQISRIIDFFWYQKAKAKLNLEFINSSEYNKIIRVMYDKSCDGINSANLNTKNFKYRHFKKNHILGAWRWLGVYENRELIKNFVFDESKKGIDFGGARGPISLFADICDWLEYDIFGRKVLYNNLSEIENESLDYIWTSHTLEHIKNIDEIFLEMEKKLKKRGVFLCHVPSYTCKRWNSGIHKYKDEKGDSSHVHTFFLSSQKKVNEVKNNFVPIDLFVSHFFHVEYSKYVGDNSIFLVAHKK
ncbi:MAG: hypothetical protein CR972_00780 [Candidatus Moraniibacteriota bacterium]|nr:MAG: hypothetical protein CR972_00780 [Candidatus Moranbacteria bacterium]